MNEPKWLSAILDKSSAYHSRSNVLYALAWLIALLIFATTTAGIFSQREWLVVGFFVATMVSVLLFLICFTWFGKNDPDLLRSEKFSIQKIAIEKGVYGDNTHGLIEQSDNTSQTIALISNEEKS